MEVADRQQLGLALGEPFACRRALALGQCLSRQLQYAMTVWPHFSFSQRAT
jgi:hypothetical protein